MIFFDFFQMAPEVVKTENYDEKCDVFSFSIIMWELFNLDFNPYGDLKDCYIQFRIAQDPQMRPKITSFKFPIEKNIIDLMKNSWSEDISKRPSFQEILMVFDDN